VLEERVVAEARAAGGRLDPVAGRMFGAVWLDAGSGVPGRLVLVAHHLAVDGVSWRVLLGDLAEAYAAVVAGRVVELDPVPVSFRQWALALAEQATGARRRAELPAWRALLSGPVVPLGLRPPGPGPGLASDLRSASRTLPAGTTADLLTRVPAAFHAGVEDVLLAALALALAEHRDRHAPLTGGGGLLVDVEGHGRAPFAAATDLSRTVGWFTSVHPVRVDPGPFDPAEARSGGPVAGRAVKAVKEQLRAVPGDGLGYGMLRHLDPESGAVLAALPAPELVFNYLGRFAAADPGAGTSGAATPGAADRTAANPGGPESPARTGTAAPAAPAAYAAPGDPRDWQPTGRDPFGGAPDPRMTAPHALEAAALVRDLPTGPELTLTLARPAAAWDDGEVTALLDGWAAMLGGLAAHAAGTGAGGHTPSDFSLVDLGQQEIDELEAELADGR
jgi:non-ribosomal peptide synthase protein (TIGR01720 family)